MQIPPTTALLNLLASLPAQGGSIATSAPAALKTQPANPSAPTAPSSTAPSSTAPSSATSAAETQPSPAMRRGSLINIVT